MPDPRTLLDWRGREVGDRDGEPIGRLQEIYLDQESDQPNWALLALSGGLRRHAFVPVAGAWESGGRMRLAFDRERIDTSPAVPAGEEISADAEAALYRHYGVEAAAPPEPREGRDRGRPADRAMTRSEEELIIRKLSRPRERVRVRRRIVSEEVTLTVTVRREELDVERLPVDPAHPAAGAAGGRPGSAPGGEPADREPLIVVLREEQPVVGTRVVARELVRVYKERTTSQQVVSGELRKEVVAVERQPIGAPSEGTPRESGPQAAPGG